MSTDNLPSVTIQTDASRLPSVPAQNGKAVIFDLDDTLFCTIPHKWAQHQETARRFYSAEISESLLRKHWGKPSRELVTAFYPSADSTDEMLRKFHSLDSEFPKTLLTDVLPALQRFKQSGVTLGVVTNARKNAIADDMQRLGIPRDLFLFVHAYEDTGAYKPDPSVFHLAISALSENGISTATYVGDSLADFYAAKEAGLDFVAVTTGLTTYNQFMKKGVTKIATSLNDAFSTLELS